MLARFALVSLLVGFAGLATPAAPDSAKPKGPVRACECCKDPCPCGCQQGAECKCGGDLGGIYMIEGKDSKRAYAGAALIKKIGAIYIIHFAVAANSSIGIGIRQGDLLAVSWTQAQDKIRGVTLYRITGAKLTGRWASLPGTGSMHDESLTFLRALPADDEED